MRRHLLPVAVAAALFGCSTAEESQIRGVSVDLEEEDQVPRCGRAGLHAEADGTVGANPTTRVVSIELSYEGLSSALTGVHLHAGGRSETGTELAGFALSDSPIRATVTLEQAAFDAFLEALDAGRVYIDLHTASCPAGALRAQVY